MENGETIEEVFPCCREIDEWFTYHDVKFDTNQDAIPDDDTHTRPIYNLTVPHNYGRVW